MIDVRQLRDQVDLLALVGQNVTLRKHASTRGGEWVGPCPFCHSGHRIHVQPATGLWFCRFCCSDKRWHDALEYVQRRDSVHFLEACRRLGAVVDQQPEPRRRPTTVEDLEPVPTSVWRKRAGELVARCQETLWSDAGARARSWLQEKRGLTESTIRDWGLGFSDPERWEDARPWGLDDPDRIWIPRGITLPWVAMGDLWQVKVRRATGKRYQAITGGHPLLFGADRLAGRDHLLLTEGELDCVLTWQQCGDLVDVATLGSCTATPRSRVLPYLLPYGRLLLAFDVDEPGEEGARKWAWTARAERMRLPLADGEGKDITDLWRAGGDLRAWVCTALPQAECESEGIV